jgi:HAD superfamily hydrolase (TIGR01484 family)
MPSCPRAILFDLDDTLAESFETPSKEMIERVLRLLARVPVAIVTGRDFPWMARDFLPQIARSGLTDRFFVFPEGAAQCLQWDGTEWKELYGESLSEEDRERIQRAIVESAEETGVLVGLPVFGERFVQKRAMIAFAALGRDVPRDLKYSWDPDNTKRAALRDAIAAKLPEFDVLMGGATSTDITKKGVNKSYGVRWLAQHLSIPAAEMLYVGDALYPGGNDYVVIDTGIQTRSTKGPEETKKIIDELLIACV